MSLVAHQFGHIKFGIFLNVFYRQVETIKKKKKKNQNSKRPNRCTVLHYGITGCRVFKAGI